jgi:hypothetical protein
MVTLHGFCRLVLAAVILAGCAGQVEPAQKAISDIDAALSASSAEAAKYVPDQLAAVQADLDGLRASFQKQDYPAVLAGAPAVMINARALAGAAAAKRDALAKALNDRWSGMAAAVPDEITGIQNQLDSLARKSSRKQAEGIDLDAARDSLSGAVSLWSKAQAAFATGNLPEAVEAAQNVESSLKQIESTLKMHPPAAAGAGRS